MNAVTFSGQTVSEQYIFYYDKGHTTGPLKNIQHWNIEKRWIDVSGKETRVPSDLDHVISDSDFLRIGCLSDDGRTEEMIVYRPRSPNGEGHTTSGLI